MPHQWRVWLRTVKVEDEQLVLIPAKENNELIDITFEGFNSVVLGIVTYVIKSMASSANQPKVLNMSITKKGGLGVGSELREIVEKAIDKAWRVEWFFSSHKKDVHLPYTAKLSPHAQVLEALGL